jgi:hypothetical protein
MSNDFCTQIERCVHSRTAGRLKRLSINRHGTAIHLKGEADTYYIKQLALHAVMEWLGDETGFELLHEIKVK